MKLSEKLVNLTKFAKKNNQKYEKPSKPKFCPKGCGETLEATPLEGNEKEIISKMSNFKNHWKIHCTICNYSSYLSEGE